MCAHICNIKILLHNWLIEHTEFSGKQNEIYGIFVSLIVTELETSTMSSAKCQV